MPTTTTTASPSLPRAPRPPADGLAIQGAVAAAFTRAPRAPTCRHCGASAVSSSPFGAPTLAPGPAPLPGLPATGGGPGVPPPLSGPGRPPVLGGVFNTPDLFDGHPEDDTAFFEDLVARGAPGMTLRAHRIDATSDPTTTRAIVLYGDVSFTTAGFTGGVGPVWLVILEERAPRLGCPSVSISPAGTVVVSGASAASCFAGYHILGSASGARAMMMEGAQAIHEDQVDYTPQDLVDAAIDQDTSAIEEGVDTSHYVDIDEAAFVKQVIDWYVFLAPAPHAATSVAGISTTPRAELGARFEKWWWAGEGGFVCGNLTYADDITIDGWDATLAIDGISVPLVQIAPIETFEDLCDNMADAAEQFWSQVGVQAYDAAYQLGNPSGFAGTPLPSLLDQFVAVARDYDASVIRDRCPCYS